MSRVVNPDVLIVGGGVAGLATAVLLHEAGAGVTVLEAGPRAGGRVASLFDDGDGRYVADLGPTWIWTPYQPVAARWLDRLGLEVFDQYEVGHGLYQTRPGQPAERVQLPLQYGARRVVGGTHAIIDRLVGRLPRDSVRTGRAVSAVARTGDEVEVIAGRERPEPFRSPRVVIAMPLRLATHAIEWQPALPGELIRALDEAPTWMAPHAKAIARYERPFWRERGLSGRIASHVGPLVETHDHCGPDGSPASLFGFVGWQPELRARQGGHELARAIEAQLVHCFGADAPRPDAIHVHDWATSPHVAAARDLQGPMAHPEAGPGILREPHLDGRIWFATSETASRSPGLVEGAFDAAERVAGAILALD